MARIIISEATKEKFDSVAKPGETPDQTLLRLIGNPPTVPSKGYTFKSESQKVDEPEDE